MGGANEISLGRSERARNIFVPRINISQRVETNLGSGGPNDLVGASDLSGQFELRRSWRSAEFSAEYGGGGQIYAENSERNSSYHNLRLRQTFSGRRWSLMLGNEISFLPESPFSLRGSGGSLMTAVFDINGTVTTFNPIFIPGQSVISGFTSRWSNASVAQLQYKLGKRSSLFVAGGYGMLRFSDPQFTDANQSNLIAGFERDLNGRNTLGVMYGLGRFRFPGQPNGINNHTVRLEFGRRLTNRMAVRIAGGPVFSMYADPLAGDSQRIFWSLNSHLKYRIARMDLGVAYDHDLTGGSGVLAGAESDIIRLTLDRQISRQWSLGVSGGYARNRGLQAFTTGPAQRIYNSEFGSVRMTRNLGREKSAFFTYSLSHQTSNLIGCSLPSCENVGLRHTFEVGLAWHPRPLRID